MVKTNKRSEHDRGEPTTTENNPWLGPVVFAPLMIVLTFALVIAVITMTKFG